MHNASAKNVLKLLEIEAHTWKLNSVLHMSQWNQQLFLEAWCSNKEENSIKEHVEFPRVYLNLKNFKHIFSTSVKYICHLLAYFTMVSHICIRN